MEPAEPRLARTTGALLIAVAGLVHAAGDEAQLRTRYAAFTSQHVADHAGRPLEIESRDDSRHVLGEIYAVLPQPFDSAAASLKQPAFWCEILLLHIDTKECAVTGANEGPVLHAGVVSHYDQPASTAYRLDLDYRLIRDTPQYVEARLDADDGPLDTSAFRIVFEAMPTEDGRTFAHMSYAYAYGGLSAFALRVYFATFGHGKVGFTVVGRDEQGRARYIGGMRGVVERNTMRYFLAFEAWLAAAALPRERRIEQALRNWYAAVERYPRQLHEVPEARYLDMKRREFGLPPR